LNLAEAGDHIVSSSSLYGGTYNLFHYSLPKLASRWTSSTTPTTSSLGRGRAPNTRAFYGETIGNPRGDVLDIAASPVWPTPTRSPSSSTTRSPRRTWPTPCPRADIVVHSATKFIGGHGTAIGGIIVDGGSFDFGASGRHKGFTEPDPSYHGLVYWDALGAGPTSRRPASRACVTTGGHRTAQRLPLHPGPRDLSLRMERHVANAQRGRVPDRA